jgi:hypothetical protein
VAELNTWIVKGSAPVAPEDLVLDPSDQELDEALLGVGFVTCQAGMAHVASRAIDLAAFCQANGIAQLGTWVAKDDVYKQAPELHAGGPSKIVFLNAVANYFKHRDEWPDVGWAQLAGLSARTAQTIGVAGLARGAKDNLRKATAALDDGIYDAVKEWADGLVAYARKELAGHL